MFDMKKIIFSCKGFVPNHTPPHMKNRPRDQKGIPACVHSKRMATRVFHSSCRRALLLASHIPDYPSAAAVVVHVANA
jgi:hypothetical protein